jgi:hypothetical protein
LAKQEKTVPMENKKTWAELMSELRQVALESQIDDETIRKFHEAFDGAEQRKRENERRLRVRLAEIRAANASAV